MSTFTLVLCVVFDKLLFVLMSFVFWPLYCLSACDLRHLITPLLSSNLPVNKFSIMKPTMADFKYFIQLTSTLHIKLKWMLTFYSLNEENTCIIASNHQERFGSITLDLLHHYVIKVHVPSRKWNYRWNYCLSLAVNSICKFPDQDLVRHSIV
jgi:hypothetical protein